jgi:hypothetical protein
MMYSPMVGDVKAATEPYPFVDLHIIEEAGQGCGTPGAPDEATVQYS